jgi:hypothetical protein
MATLPAVFGELEAAVDKLPDTYFTKKVGYKAWIADAKTRYTTPPPDVIAYIEALKAAGTAFRENRDVPPVAAGQGAAAEAAAAKAKAEAETAAKAKAEAEAAAAAAAKAPGEAAAAKAPGEAAAAAAAEAAPSAAPPPPSAAAPSAAPANAAAAAAPSAAPPPPSAAAPSAAPANAAAEEGRAANAGQLNSVENTLRLGDIAGNDAELNAELAKPEADQDGDKIKRLRGLTGRGRHLTPKRRRSGKKGRKGLSKKKTGSRK